jgi:cell division protein FtsI/penicillin-binding protein 2
MTEVLQFSINTGVVFAERKLGHEKFLEYVEKFGIFEPTNIELAGEVFSKNTEFKKGYEVNFSTAAFGQGIEMTPLQILKAFSPFANNGLLVDPHISEGEHSKTKQVISPRTASQITSMLTSVVQSGFAKTAQIPGYHIAGKTGTAQISWSALGVAKSGYSDKTIQSFIGYAPAFDPRFLILVKLNNPATRTAEYSAVPIFRDLAKYIIDYYQIPPDFIVE